MRMRSLGVAALGAALLSACAQNELTAPNLNNVSAENIAADPANAIPLLMNGVLVQQRATIGGVNTGYYSSLGRFGRESYLLNNTEGRFHSHWFIGIGTGANQRVDWTGFVPGTAWAGPYANLRNLFNMRNALSALPAAEAQGTKGWIETMEALELLMVVTTRDTLGAPVEVYADPTQLAPFVSRDSVYNRLIAKLDSGYTNLTASGAAFAFTLPAGGWGAAAAGVNFSTPAGFALFNRGLAARARVHMCKIAGNVPVRPAFCTAALAALGQATAWLPAAGPYTTAQLNAGPRITYSSTAGDALNPLFRGNSPFFVAHDSIRGQAEAGDPRLSKLDVLASPAAPNPASNGIPTSSGFNGLVNSATASLAYMRAEELLLLRAEAKALTNDLTGAISDVNALRAAHGLGAANVVGTATPLTVAAGQDDVIDRILYEKRYSVMLEGQRWIDLRRHDKLTASATTPRQVALNVDIPSHFIARFIPIPQGECLVRARSGQPLSALPAVNPIGCDPARN